MSQERRHALRVPLQMWVEEKHERATYFQHSSNLSRGGIYLEKTLPHPVGTVVSLQFTLPGDATELHVQAEIVSALMDDGATPGMGLKFISPSPDVAQRIDRFIAGYEQP